MPAGDGALRLITLRSSDQFTSSVYSDDDPYREVHGGRRVLLMNVQDMTRLGIAEGQRVTVTSCAADAVRKINDLCAIAYDIPEGCAAGYYPECNPLIPVWHRAKRSHVPVAKFIAVRVTADG